jgi:glycerate-2-kinase
MDEREGRKIARSAVAAAISALDPRALVRKTVSVKDNTITICGDRTDLSKIRRLLVLGTGKASGAMAEELEKIVRVDAGVVSVPEGTAHKFKTKNIELLEAGHPRPDGKSVEAAEAVIGLAKSAGAQDLAICLISGGGSALLSLPAEGISVDEKADLSIALMKHGADIHELNTVRRHLSRIKGGHLAQVLANSAHSHTLIISDVVGNQLQSIASGPTVADPTTFADAARILKKYNLWSGTARTIMEDGMAGRREETLKKQPKKVHNYIIGSNKSAIIAACKHLHANNVQHMQILPEMTGEARIVGAKFSLLLAAGHSFVAGGETTVTVKGSGIGGRNQELALAAALKIAGKSAVLASVGTDGIDGSSKAAGAVVDGKTIARAKALGLNAATYLKSNDSNTFFRKLGDEIITGPTGTNGNDIIVGIAFKPATPRRRTR